MRKLFFDLHWILGITAGIIITLVSVTGAFLSYEQELLRLFNKSSYSFEAGQKQLSTKELLEKFSSQMPEAIVTSVAKSSNPNEIVGITIEGSARKRGDVYHLNPYTGEILPLVKGKAFFAVSEDLHRRLMFGGTGSTIVGICSIMLLFLVVSGVYLYYPKIKRGFVKSFTFKTKTTGRAFLYGLHCSVGMWVSLFYAWLVLTGLFWSFDWYRSGVYALLGLDAPVRKERPQRMAMPKASETDAIKKYVQVENAFDIFENSVDGYAKATLQIPQKGSEFSISYFDPNYTHKRESNSMKVDVKAQRVVSNDRYEDKPLNEQIVRSMLPLHSGEYFGWIGVLIMFLSSLLMPLFTITGIMLYIERFKRTRLNKLKKQVK